MDLFHGQFRFKTACANEKCRKESITYSPFTYVSMPVPLYQYVTLDLFYVQYYITDMYYNEKLQIIMRDDLKICDLRSKIEKKYGFAEDSYLISWVLFNKIAEIYSNQISIKELAHRSVGGITVLYQIPEKLKPSLKNVHPMSEDDENYGIDEDYIKLCVRIS